ncbi:MAG: tRNA (N(6)-L-threonylcarbamoyladenosine(37)-C(2))-methylthiotransferase [DPANN group archaeon]|nr:tRNA (N(6)-L-threonylcarbamoyladenosine(37)-C(2))-methylthiotransferase [DPANN group archaeon]
MNIYIETYGCSANQSNSEIMGGLLLNAGHNIVSEDAADIIIINSCTVKLPTERKIYKRIEKLKFSDKLVIISGCMPEVQKDEILKLNSNVSFLGINAIDQVVDLVNSISSDMSSELFTDIKTELVGKPKLRTNKNINIVQISSGCNFDCSYCVVRSAKGSLKSFSPNSIINDIKEGLDAGCKEIWLTSQDTAAYGTDTGIRLPALLRKICAINGTFKIRLGMMNPQSIKPIMEDLIDSYSNSKIYNFLHIPVQSGSDKVLNDMGRRYTSEEFLDIVNSFRSRIKDLTVSTDIIVGYPTEDVSDFNATVALLEELNPNIVNISKYGPRPMTRAAKLPLLSFDVVKQRSKTISDLCSKVTLKNSEKMINWTGSVLISEIGPKGGFITRNASYKPILIQKGVLGSFIDVKVTEVQNGYLIGE